MAKRNENGRFTTQTEETESSTPATDSRKPVVERAREALEEILDAAITSKDQDRILEVSKLLANFRKGSPDAVDPFRERINFVISKMTAEEKTEVHSLILRAQAIYAAVGMRYGLKPLFPESFGSNAQGQILDAARELNGGTAL